MSSEQCKGRTPRSISASDAVGSILYDQASLGFHTTLLRSKNVRIGAIQRSETHIRNANSNIESTHAGFPCLTSSAATKTSETLIPAAPRAEVAYFRVAEVHMAHFGLGNVPPDASCEGAKLLRSANRMNDKTAYILDDGTDARKFDDAPATSSTLKDCRFKFFDLTLRDAPSQTSDSAKDDIVITLSFSGSSIPQSLRRFSAVRIP